MTTKEAKAPRHGLEHVIVPIQQFRIASAAKKEDWGKIKAIALKTKSPEVGMHAVDRLAEADKQKEILSVAKNAELQEIIKYSADHFAKERRWRDLERISYAHTVYTENDEASAYADSLFKKATNKDVDNAIELREWRIVREIGIWGSEATAKYAIDKEVEHASHKEGDKRARDLIGIGVVRISIEAARSDEVIKHVLDKAVETHNWGGVATLMKLSRWPNLSNVTEYAKEQFKKATKEDVDTAYEHPKGSAIASTLEYIGRYGNDEVAKYAMGKLVEARNWSALSEIETYGTEFTAKHAKEQLMKATKEDVDKAAEARDWNSIAAISMSGAEAAAQHAREQFKKVTKKDLKEVRDASCGPYDRSALKLIGQHGTEEVAKHVVDIIGTINDDILGYIGQRGAGKVAKHAVDKLLADEFGINWQILVGIGVHGGEEVAKYVVDKAFEALHVDTLTSIGQHGAVPVVKYMVDIAVAKGYWNFIEFVSLNGPAEAAKYAKGQFTKATRQDVDVYVTGRRWDIVGAICIRGSKAAAQYAKDQFKKATKEDVDKAAGENATYIVSYIAEYGPEGLKKYARERER